MKSGLSEIGVLWSILSFLAAAASSVGSFLPYWLEGFIHLDNGIMPTSLGIFRRCNYLAQKLNSSSEIERILECGRYAHFSDIPSIWWQAATLTVVVGCCLSVVVAMSAMLCCCIKDSMSKNLARMACFVQFLGGFLVAAGCILFPLGWDNVSVQQACGMEAHQFRKGSCTISWAYYTTIAGASCLLVCSVMALFSIRHKGGYQKVSRI